MTDKSLEVIVNRSEANEDSAAGFWSARLSENQTAWSKLRIPSKESKTQTKKPEPSVVFMDPLHNDVSPVVSQYGEPRLDGENFRVVLKLRIRTARKNSGHTQGSMARKIGVKEATYAKWENTPVGMIPLHFLPRFCELTKICPTNLIYPYLTDMERRILVEGA